MDHLNKLLDLSLRNVLEPGLNWVLNHPVVSVVVIAALIYFSVRNYRML
ncbi:MAG TPA: hypothetical protein VMT22_02355 [Terriglobales bacterium]|jgi:hypothetical protein|nr:hypothetical protein [Terriglobales bacterium]